MRMGRSAAETTGKLETKRCIPKGCQKIAGGRSAAEPHSHQVKESSSVKPKLGIIGKSGYPKAVLCIRAISPIFSSNDLDAIDKPACLGRIILNLMPMGLCAALRPPAIFWHPSENVSFSQFRELSYGTTKNDLTKSRLIDD